MGSTITRDTWTNDSGTAANPVGDGTAVGNAQLQNHIYARVDEMFAGGASYDPLIFGGAVQSDGQPRCSAYSNAVQSVPDTAVTALTLNAEDYDVGSMHSNATNISRLTVPAGQGGLYLIIGSTTFAANAVGYRDLLIRKNGSTFLREKLIETDNGVYYITLEVTTVAVLAAGDYVELTVQQNSGGNLNVGSATRYSASMLQMVRLW